MQYVQGADGAQEADHHGRREVYQGLHKVVGRRHISRFLTELARPHVVQDDLEAGYRAMAADEEHEREAMAWVEGVVADVADEPG